MRGLDFSSRESLLATVLGLALFALIGVGARLVVMMTIQQRRERANRQINERLKALIAAYKVLGGSFTGDLAVDPRHLRDLRRRGEAPAAAGPGGTAAVVGESGAPVDLSSGDGEGSDRTRRIRDAVETALSDVILLGTGTHLRLAERAARELAAGRPVHTHELVVALRASIREALDLDPIPADLMLPTQGPTRPSGGGARGERSGQAGARGGGMGGGGADVVDDAAAPAPR